MKNLFCGILTALLAVTAFCSCGKAYEEIYDEQAEIDAYLNASYAEMSFEEYLEELADAYESVPKKLKFKPYMSVNGQTVSQYDFKTSKALAELNFKTIAISVDKISETSKNAIKETFLPTDKAIRDKLIKKAVTEQEMKRRKIRISDKDALARGKENYDKMRAEATQEAITQDDRIIEQTIKQQKITLNEYLINSGKAELEKEELGRQILAEGRKQYPEEYIDELAAKAEIKIY